MHVRLVLDKQLARRQGEVRCAAQMALHSQHMLSYHTRARERAGVGLTGGSVRRRGAGGGALAAGFPCAQYPITR